MIQTPEENSLNLVDTVVKGVQEVKGKEIVTIDLRDIPNSMSQFFVICHGTSNKHVEAIAESVEREVEKELSEKPSSTEGEDRAEWILIDYFDVVVHVFQKQARDFYQIEKLWADADVKEIAYEV